MFEAELDERQALRLEAGLTVGTRCGAQASIQPVRPRVVRALDRPVPRPVDELGATMTADVEEGAQILAVPHDENRHVADLRSELVAVLGDHAPVPDVLPGRWKMPCSRRSTSGSVYQLHGRVCISVALLAH